MFMLFIHLSDIMRPYLKDRSILLSLLLIPEYPLDDPAPQQC